MMTDKLLAGKRILLVNDDGINAPGLKSLEHIAHCLSDDVWVVAPETEQSGKGHALTIADPLRLRQLSERKFAVDGTPTDCVVMAVNKVLADIGKPDLVLSGVNRGANLANDVTYSGTVSAAMEGLLMGIPSIALSQHYLRRHPVKWATVEHHAPEIIAKLFAAGWAPRSLLNINFPDMVAQSVLGVKITTLGMPDADSAGIDERLDPRGNPYYWIGLNSWDHDWPEDCDVAAIQAGYISVTPVEFDLTHRDSMASLQNALNPKGDQQS